MLTDGGRYYSEKGEMLKKFHVRDGMGVNLLLRNEIMTIIVTKENSKITKKWAKEMNVTKIILGSLKKENELSKMKDKFSNVLNDFELKIYPVNIEGKGMYYRIQAGPIKTSDEAKNLCNELTRLQKKCFVRNY